MKEIRTAQQTWRSMTTGAVQDGDTSSWNRLRARCRILVSQFIIEFLSPLCCYLYRMLSKSALSLVCLLAHEKGNYPAREAYVRALLPSTMAGIGEVSAIASVISLGFSLATTLNTFISDVTDARDDISSLISDIEATVGQLRDLGKLIEKNETTKARSEDGLRNAKKCVTDCERIIVKLRKLLNKSAASTTSVEVKRDEIDVSKLERSLWSFMN